MSQFVDQCRSEWRRLGIPDGVANEMAAELEADLNEAEGDGASVEEVLGTGAFDPRAFAASWAAARGVIPAPPVRAPRRVPVLAVILAAVAIVAVVAAVALLTVQRTTSVAIAGPLGQRPGAFLIPPGGQRRIELPNARFRISQPASRAAIVARPLGVILILLLLGAAGGVGATLMWTRRPLVR